MSASARSRRAWPSPSASTVLAPSTVSARLSVTTPQEAFSLRYPAGARRRYHRAAPQTGGAPIRHGRTSSGVSRAMAPAARPTARPPLSPAGAPPPAVSLSELLSPAELVQRAPPPAPPPPD